MLRLPAEDALPGPLMLEREDDSEDFEEAGTEPAPKGGNFRLVAGTGLAALVVLGLFAWWLMPDKESVKAVEPLAADTVASEAVVQDLAPETAKTDVVEIDSVTRHFLQATSIEELQPWIRLPEATLPKIKAWSGGSYTPPGFKGMAGDYDFTPREGLQMVVVPVRTADYEKRNLAVVKEAAGWRADWESWAGWSEMSWQDFRSAKPVEAKLFRVLVAQVDYYNFGFKDDLEWRSYRLDSLDEGQSLFGYVKRGSDIDVKIDPREPEGHKRMIVMLKFPPEAAADNQVLIDRIVAEGWVDPGTPVPP